jgi:hypothetical protein
MLFRIAGGLSMLFWLVFAACLYFGLKWQTSLILSFVAIAAGLLVLVSGVFPSFPLQRPMDEEPEEGDSE